MTTEIARKLPIDASIDRYQEESEGVDYFSAPTVKINKKSISSALEERTCENYNIFNSNIKYIINLFVSTDTKNEKVVFNTLMEQYGLRSKKEIKLLFGACVEKFKKDVVLGKIENGPEWLAAISDKQVAKRLEIYSKIGFIVTILFLFVLIIEIFSWGS